MSDRTHGGAGVIRSILYGVAGLVLAILVLRVTLINAVATTANVAGPVPADQAFMRDATAQYTKAHRLPSRAYAVARRIARQQPLASGPFAVVALEAIDRNRPRLAITLLEAGRRRNPRDRFIRLLLLEQYAVNGAFDKAAGELSVLYRLVPDVGTALIDIMTRIALQPDGLQPLARAMHGEQAMGPLLANLVKTGAPLDTIMVLARGAPAPSDVDEMVWRKLLLQRLVAEGRYAQARDLWATFASLPVAQRQRPFFNLALAPSPALPPFNWKTADETIGSVDLTGRGAATIAYFGREGGPLLSQLMMLSPGSYRLRYVLEGGRQADVDTMVWHMRCAVPGTTPASGRTLLEAPVHVETADRRATTIAFTVPGGCAAQWLSLEGVSSEFPQSQTVEISGMTLVRREQ